jgi:hypothetical protein
MYFSKNYLLVEMAAIRDPKTGTWLVKAVTDMMDALKKDVDLLTFLICVQNNICNQRQDTISYGGVTVLNGQTPELRIFPIPPISMCRIHNDTPNENLPIHPPATP